jgi:hypothetical protein
VRIAHGYDRLTPLQSGVVGAYPVQGVWFSSHLLMDGIDRIHNFWVITDNLRYPGYKTLTVAPKPSVERVAGAGHLIGGRIGTHMKLRVPPWDSEVRLWG